MEAKAGEVVAYNQKLEDKIKRYLRWEKSDQVVREPNLRTLIKDSNHIPMGVTFEKNTLSLH